MKAIAPEWNQWMYASSGAITQSPFEKRVKKTHVTYIITRTNLLFFIFIRNDVALTGEIDLNGSIHEIGGLEHKIEGGKMAGVKLILYPTQNEKDIEQIKSKGYILDNNIKIIVYNTILYYTLWKILDIKMNEYQYEIKVSLY